MLLNACQSVKEGLTGQKQSNSDEFLVEKKNPLVLPPEFDKLPEPETLIRKKDDKEEQIDLKSILTDSSLTSSEKTDKISSGNLEKSILEKIKNN